MSDPAAPLKLVEPPQATEQRKLPFLKFFPTDWRADPKLRACALAARGLWIEMVGLMHEANPRGYLRINGHPPNDVELARQVGATPREVRSALAELRKNDVLSVTADGILYSRRMLRDARRGAANGKNGAKGATARWGHGKRRGEQHGEPNGEQHGPREPEARSHTPIPPSVLTDEVLGDRARGFLERYPVVYAKCRAGAHYKPKEARDFPTAVELVDAHRDDDRLDSMLEVFLRMASADCRGMNKPGTVKQFASYAPECDRLLRENGR